MRHELSRVERMLLEDRLARAAQIEDRIRELRRQAAGIVEEALEPIAEAAGLAPSDVKGAKPELGDDGRLVAVVFADKPEAAEKDDEE